MRSSKQKSIPPLSLRDRVVEMKRVKASDLVDHPENFRRHEADQQRALTTMLSEIGFAGVVLTRKLPGGKLQIIDGHLRKALAGSEKIPVVVTDLNENEARKLLASYDPLGAMAGTDKDALKALLEKLSTDASAGFQSVIDAVAREYRVALQSGGLGDPDEIPEPPKVPTSKTGDLYVLGKHRLLCGDSTKADDVARVLNGEKPFLLLTDPPYGVSLDMEWRDRAGLNGLGPAQPSYLKKRQEGHENTSISGSQQIIWDKQRFVYGRNHYHWQHEPCWYARKKGSPPFLGSKDQTTIWAAASPKALMNKGMDREEKVDHPTQKPVVLYTRPIENHLKGGELFYEPFGGSGTGIIAAEMTGRRCFAIEIDPIYCDVIVSRWERFTGQTAVLERGGGA